MDEVDQMGVWQRREAARLARERTTKLRKLMVLVDEYGRQCSVNNEMDNRSAVQRARDAVVQALKEELNHA